MTPSEYQKIKTDLSRNQISKLSAHEKRLLRFRKEGLSNQEIARGLGVSHGHVRNCFSIIYKKLQKHEHDMSLIDKVLQNQ